TRRPPTAAPSPSPPRTSRRRRPDHPGRGGRSVQGAPTGPLPHHPLARPPPPPTEVATNARGRDSEVTTSRIRHFPAGGMASVRRVNSDPLWPRAGGWEPWDRLALNARVDLALLGVP